MDNQPNRFKEAIIEILLKRIIPLEKQLEAQTEIIDQLTQSLEALSSILSINQDRPKRLISPKTRPNDPGSRMSQQKLNEDI
jgi:hypothetical protein